MNHADAQTIADELILQLQEHCGAILVAGSLRRRRPEVNDIDIVLEPKPYAGQALHQQLYKLYGRSPEKSGSKYIMLENYKGIQVDLYFATEDTWTTLLVIRTGSAQHNIKLCQRARELSMTLKANGQGLLCGGRYEHPETERQLFDMLRLPYKEPWEREA